MEGMIVQYQPVKCLLGKILEQRGLRQVDLCDKLGFKPSQVSDFVNDRRIMSLANAMTIAKYLRVDVMDLYRWDRTRRPRKD
jgi:transcriptional regulator with XRE-family HTH domain